MKKNYFYITLLAAIFFTTSAAAQDSKQPKTQQDASIEGLNLYPNPVANELNIVAKNNNTINAINIVDMNGRTVKNSNDAGMNNTSVNVSDLNAGIYFVTIETNEGTGTSKFIKK